MGKVGAKCCEYSFNDSPPLEGLGVVYYRLEMVDKDGSKTYSEVRTIELRGTNYEVRLFPNPAKDVVTIEFAGAKQLLLIDYLGKTVKQINNPTPQQTINIKQLPKGVYVVQVVTTAGVEQIAKFIKE